MKRAEVKASNTAESIPETAYAFNI